MDTNITLNNGNDNNIKLVKSFNDRVYNIFKFYNDIKYQNTRNEESALNLRGFKKMVDIADETMDKYDNQLIPVLEEFLSKVRNKEDRNINDYMRIKDMFSETINTLQKKNIYEAHYNEELEKNQELPINTVDYSKQLYDHIVDAARAYNELIYINNPSLFDEELSKRVKDIKSMGTNEDVLMLDEYVNSYKTLFYNSLQVLRNSVVTILDGYKKNTVDDYLNNQPADLKLAIECIYSKSFDNSVTKYRFENYKENIKLNKEIFDFISSYFVTNVFNEETYLKLTSQSAEYPDDMNKMLEFLKEVYKYHKYTLQSFDKEDQGSSSRM